MSGLYLCFVNFIILLLYVSQTHCNEGDNLEPIPGVYFYDSTQEDLLFDTVKEIHSNISKIEGILLTQNDLVSKISILEYQNSELSKKLSTLSEQVNELIQKSNNNGNEACMEIDRKFDEFKVGQNDKSSIILQQIKETNENLDHTKTAVNTKLEKIDENLLQVTTNSEQSSKSLQDIGTTLEELQKDEEKEKTILENMNNTNCGLKDSTISVNVKNLDEFRNEVLSVRNESSTLYSGCEEAVKYNGRSGVYSLRIFNSKFSTFKAYCLEDPNDEGPAWTIIQRRDEKSGHFIDFNRTWEEYKNGFGDLEYDHWLGLNNIYNLTNSNRHQFWMHSNDGKKHALNPHYDDFKIADESKNFKISSIGQNPENMHMPSCLGKDFNTFHRGDKAWVNSNGGGGFWGPCSFNYNTQSKGKDGLRIGTLIVDYYQAKYVHLAIRRMMN